MHWTTDAVSGLPRTKRGFDAIQVYVDRLTKLKRFAAARTTDGSVQLAGTTLRTIIGPHGMPKSIVSDRDPRITARFWRELSRVLGSEVNLSTAQHPQSDGQSEREIQTLITALRSYVNAMGNDWDEYLPALELAFNSKQQASTGAAPFTLVYGTEARLPIDCALDDARPATVPAVEQRAERMKQALDLRAQQGGDARRPSRSGSPIDTAACCSCSEGDQVLLATEGLQLRSGTHKLTARYIGPFRVLGTVNDNAVTLELPPLLGALHPTFNISRLKLYRDGRALFPGRPQRLHAAAGGGDGHQRRRQLRGGVRAGAARQRRATRAAGALEGLRRRARRVAAAQRAGAHARRIVVARVRRAAAGRLSHAGAARAEPAAGAPGAGGARRAWR